ncbi:FAD-binding and (Fe-S)-binding domain-containing protein [Amycolatopsis endophytica]|uniref:FAD/FMN-containing dehydrogenase/Fe-S oxidoreductase n=1 Tax=Amycolatopsis endophytica TaxID=860233 RepID=A0A853BDL9_9PSEU|nr:FAD-binding and (Fe-S)-binding domain-containing protein [Amycolatopsis endophytica]NYI93473.1 FAD/FMN-containing dehydrogenase/Fe-S oxidoreductase [Amycolatopsis endophytica]
MTVATDERVARFLGELGHALTGEVESGTTARATYSMDASNYRHVPVAVVFPSTVEDLETTVRLCREYGIPITARGSGTSIGGQALGRGVVVDYSRHLDRVLEIDPQARTARVQPGVVLDALRAAAAPHGLTFGPDPSTHSRCTIGGMVGNDACGSHSVAWGRTADNVIALDVLTADGARLVIGPELPEDPRVAASKQLALDNLALLRTAFPTIPRRVSGYALEQLLPENGTNLVRALVGTEGTCVLLTEITVRLVPAPAARALVVAGYADDIAAADAVPSVLPLKPLTVEGMGRDLIDSLLTRRSHPAVDLLPEGRGWLFVEVGGADAADAAARAADVADVLTRETGAATVVETRPADQRVLWSVREAAAGIVTRMADGSEAWPGWEDSAVPPANLGVYLRDFRALLGKYGLTGVPYGHFGEGCVHVRINFGLTSEEGRRQFRAFMEDAADLVVRHGGSLSGEHGDGQARAELLSRMYPPEILALFERFKAIWDPGDLLNPGNLVHPRALDADLRFDGPVRSLPLTLKYPHDGGSLATATRRCVGVGACVDKSSGVMCPSYMVTGREEHSTRGRSHLLFEMMRGETITDGWRSSEVLEALDLCLACKGCLSDCPVNVDMASYKAEFLHQHYRGRLRPASHYTLGFLPVLSRLASAAPRLANRVLGGRLSGLVKKAGGITPERSLPRFAPRTFRRGFRGREQGRPRVVLWPDTFTNFLSPEVGHDAVRVLEHAGFDVVLPSSSVCCGLTWISTGQLGVARKVLRRTLRVLRPELEAGTPVVGLEPSCLAVFRHDSRELLDEAELHGLPSQAFTLAEFLERYAPDVEFPRVEATAITQQHCHQHAVVGNAAEERLLRRVGVANRTLDSGCCGLAGNFGVEKGHYEVSVGAAARVLVPEVNAASPDTMVLADGFSCRTQIDDLTGREALHLAQVLARALDDGVSQR